MITVIVSGRGASWRLDTPNPDRIGQWLMDLFNAMQLGGYGDHFQIEISGRVK